MSLKTSNEYRSHFPFIYASASCFYYYPNSSQLYQLPISSENSPVKSGEQISLKQTANTRLSKKSQQYNPNGTAKQPYQSTDSTVKQPHQSTDSTVKQPHQSTDSTVKQPHQSMNSTDARLTSSGDNKMNNMHQLHSPISEENPKIVKQQSLEKSSLISQSTDTSDESQENEFSFSIDDCCRVLRDQSATISIEKLVPLLDKLTFKLKSLNKTEQQPQKLSIIIDILNALIYVRPSVIVSASQNEFFSILQISFIHILRQWHGLSSLQDNEFNIFRIMAKLTQRLIKATDDVKLIPSWLSNSTLLEAISNCLKDIAISGKFLHERNKGEFKSFTRLIDGYIKYQQRLHDENHSQKDTLLPLLDPILQCLTSSYFINTFANMPIDAKSMTTIEEFFLVKCPSFLTSYNGSRLEQIMKTLLSTMLPQYVQLLDKLVPSAHNWKRSTIHAVRHLFEIINHGAHQFPTNAKLVSGHLSLIDNVLKLVNEPIFYNNLLETLSNPETTLMNTAISFLVNMIGEPTILAYIKRSHATPLFLRLTECQYEPLVFNVYALLAYTTREEDIKAMRDPGRLLTTIMQSLEATLNQKPDKKTKIEQLLEAVKGLIQHDQIKDEIIKQNALPFLLECTNKLNKKSLVLVFEILWSLTFFEEIARALRANSNFLERIQTISKDNTNIPLKKAADGLVWKLIQEDTFLEKVTQEEERESQTDEIITKEILIGEDGEEEKVITTTKRRSLTPDEQTFQYDIMISYCHADKELTYKIHKFLVDQGFKVWIDLDNMYGPAMNAMAEAVENSEFVIMCMSDSYKQSTYCQAEAEYAFKCKRRLIPLIMREGYRPDGWLGFMIGSRMYIDFNRFDFDTACEKVATEISLQRRPTIPAVVIDRLDHEKPTEPDPVVQQRVEETTKSSSKRHREKLLVKRKKLPSILKPQQSKLDFARKPISIWTKSDVLDFLVTHDLDQLIPLCEEMNGGAFIELYKICISHRLRAYSVIKKELKSKCSRELSLNIYSQFLSVTGEAINSLSTPLQSAEPLLPLKSAEPLLPLKSAEPSLPSYYPRELLNSIPFVPAPNLEKHYDFSITSNASPLDTLKLVEHFSPQLQILDSLRRQILNVF